MLISFKDAIIRLRAKFSIEKMESEDKEVNCSKYFYKNNWPQGLTLQGSPYFGVPSLNIFKLLSVVWDDQWIQTEHLQHRVGPYGSQLLKMSTLKLSNSPSGVCDKWGWPAGLTIEPRLHTIGVCLCSFPLSAFRPSVLHMRSTKCPT